MITPKTWGFEDEIINTDYCGKRMFVKEQYCSSIHRHKIKDETLMIGNEGWVYFESGEEPDNMTGIFLSENNRIRVRPGTWHRFTALRESSIIEFSTHHDDSDTERHNKSGMVGKDEFRALLAKGISNSLTTNVLEEGEASEKARVLRDEGRIIGMCNGCFDLLHAGHVHFLSQAKIRCEVLFVVVNDDASVKALKGPKRPFIDEIGRMGMVASLKCVDYVVACHGTNALSSVEAIKPHVYMTTTEYGTTGPEGMEARRLGAKIEVIQMLPEYSTTRISNAVKR